MATQLAHGLLGSLKTDTWPELDDATFPFPETLLEAGVRVAHSRWPDRPKDGLLKYHSASRHHECDFGLSSLSAIAFLSLTA